MLVSGGGKGTQRRESSCLLCPAHPGWSSMGFLGYFADILAFNISCEMKLGQGPTGREHEVARLCYDSNSQALGCTNLQCYLCEFAV